MLTAIESFKEWAVELMEYAYANRKQGNEYGYESLREQVWNGLDDLAEDLTSEEFASLEKWIKSIKQKKKRASILRPVFLF